MQLELFELGIILELRCSLASGPLVLGGVRDAAGFAVAAAGSPVRAPAQLGFTLALGSFRAALEDADPISEDGKCVVMEPVEVAKRSTVGSL
jgi:uncharacterized protein (DUF697 family)